MDEDIKQQLRMLRNEIDDIYYLLQRKTGMGSADIKGKISSNSTIAGSAIEGNSVTKSKMASDSVGNTNLDTELVTLAFGAGDTTKNTTVTSGSVIIGAYESSVTSTPAQGELQLVVSGTTLTGTRSAACGGSAGITYTIILLKT